MRTIFFFLFLFFFSTMLDAQNNYKQGYLITNENDTIRGLINLRTDKKNAKSCDFKETEADNSKIYFPGEIAGYRFIDEGRYYVTKDIKIDSIPRKVFIEYLLQGTMNLYFYADDLEYYFFEDEKGKQTYITKKPDDKTTDRGDEKYKGIMFYLFKDTYPVAQEAYKTPFNRESIKKLTKKYHEEMCTSGEQCIEFEAKKEKKFIAFKYSIYAGLGFQNYSFYDERLALVNPFKYISPTIGGQVNFYIPQSSESFSLLVDLSLSSVKADEEKSYKSNEGYTSKVKFNFDALTFVARLGMKYTYPKGKYRPTVEGGATLSSLFSKSSTYYYETTVQVTPFEKNNYILPETSFLGYYAALGLDMSVNKKQFVFVRVVYDNAKRNGDQLKTIQVRLGYTF